MAKVFRGMFADSGRPAVASDKNSLGITTPAERPAAAPSRWVPDVVPDTSGHVIPGQGMSVAPSATDLPVHRVPIRLQGRGLPRAIGSDKLFVWSHGTGEFQPADVADGLTLRPDLATHGLIEPAEPMPLDVYRRHLTGTAPDWTVDEP